VQKSCKYLWQFTRYLTKCRVSSFWGPIGYIRRLLQSLYDTFTVITQQSTHDVLSWAASSSVLCLLLWYKCNKTAALNMQCVGTSPLSSNNLSPSKFTENFTDDTRIDLIYLQLTEMSVGASPVRNINTLHSCFIEQHHHVTIMTSSGHVRSSATWPIDGPWTLSYRLSIGTIPENCRIRIILKKNHDVTIMRSSGHVTSIGTNRTIPLSGFVSEIFSRKYADRMTDRMTDGENGRQKWY